MIRSMTGFGRASGKAGDRLFVSVLVKSVNHRYLEVSVKLPELLWELEPAVRALAAEQFHRGKVDISVRAERIADPEYEVRISRSIAGRILPELKNLMTEFGMEANLTASDLLRVPDLVQVRPRENELEEREREEIRTLVLEAFRSVSAMRETEGAALERDIRGRLAELSEALDRLIEMGPAVRQEAVDLYRLRIEEVARISGVSVDADRVAQETVLLVEKSDIAEEMARARSHVHQIEELIASREPAGKKLDFLSQELLREVNTTGQKSRSAAIRSLVVELKAAVERIREQVQNVE